MSDDPEVAELSLRAIRLVTTRLDNLLGVVSAEETTTLLALEFSEVDESLNLVGALAAVGAVAIILMSQGLGVEPEEVLTEIKSVMAPRRGEE